MAAQPGAALLTLQSVKERMREKLQGPLRAVRLNTTLAAKIKTKTLNNSSILKISLKHNNKVLACALTAEREKSRRLESDRMFLQKEVTMLNFQNALLRQNLSLLNKMLKDIDLFMNVNLPAAIEISEIEHSADLSTSEPRRSERFSRHSALSLGEEQGFRCVTCMGTNRMSVCSASLPLIPGFRPGTYCLMGIFHGAQSVTGNGAPTCPWEQHLLSAPQ
uniref:Shugoshin 2 n=1 Tax=Xenopus tropicalis TaxID=8364 RepID=A0A1B8XWZ1_XENTR